MKYLENQRIKKIKSKKELSESVKVLRTSFLTVAHNFNLTKENAPTNPAFITFDKLNELKNKGLKLYGIYNRSKKRQIGFVVIEKVNKVLYYMEKLCVLPDFRHNGYGKLLMDYVFNYVRKKKGNNVSIGIINKNLILKDYYIKYGFVEINLKKFDHLPFTVCFMEKKLE
ncbi:MAG: GNAT family N-acetyltransferase [Promethearchaeota archaeon]